MSDVIISRHHFGPSLLSMRWLSS